MVLTEKITRKKLIDQALLAAGWRPILPYDSKERYGLAAVEEYPTANGPADYLLFSSGAPLAIVEAKKLTVGPQNVLKQAQRYASGLTNSPFNFDGYRVPFIYSTNGQVIWFQDLRQPDCCSRKVEHCHTPASLEKM